MGSDYPWRFCRLLSTSIECFREGQIAAPTTGANTTTLTGSPGCSSCCIPQQSQPWVSGLSFHNSNLGLAQMLQVMPLSVQKLVLELILVLCSAALIPEMARKRIRSADLGMLGEENIGILWYKTFLLFLSHFSISIHLHWIHRMASLSHYLWLSQLFKDKQINKQLKTNNKNPQPKSQFTPNFWIVEKSLLRDLVCSFNWLVGSFQDRCQLLFICTLLFVRALWPWMLQDWEYFCEGFTFFKYFTSHVYQIT